MEEFEQSSRFGIGNGGVRAKFRRLKSEIEGFKLSSRLGIGNGGVRAQFRCFESEMEEFESSSDSCNREWKSSS